MRYNRETVHTDSLFDIQDGVTRLINKLGYRSFDDYLDDPRFLPPRKFRRNPRYTSGEGV
jgi:hypothetical protein